MPKHFQTRAKEELRELHLALALRIAQLTKMNTSKMDRAEKAKAKRHLDLTKELHRAVQKARGR
jgi:hypothetical protein